VLQYVAGELGLGLHLYFVGRIIEPTESATAFVSIGLTFAPVALETALKVLFLVNTWPETVADSFTHTLITK